jgi:hypothetical protein
MLDGGIILASLVLLWEIEASAPAQARLEEEPV